MNVTSGVVVNNDVKPRSHGVNKERAQVQQKAQRQKTDWVGLFEIN